MYKYIELWDNLLFSIYNLLSWIRFNFYDKFKYHDILEKNKSLYNSHDGEDCFIVLNGPSLAKYNLDSLKNKTVICSNNFALSKYYDVVKPDYHCIVDSDFFSGTLLDRVKKLIHEKKNVKYIFNKKALSVLTAEEQENAYFMYGHHLPTLTNVKFDLAAVMSSANNVGLFCIQFAMYMGFKNIYILGLDFNPGPLDTCYGNIPEEQYGLDVYKKRSRLEQCAFHWYYYLVQVNSYYIENEAQKRGINIYNLNKESSIRAFRIKTYNKLL